MHATYSFAASLAVANRFQTLVKVLDGPELGDHCY